MSGAKCLEAIRVGYVEGYLSSPAPNATRDYFNRADRTCFRPLFVREPLSMERSRRGPGVRWTAPPIDPGVERISKTRICIDGTDCLGAMAAPMNVTCMVEVGRRRKTSEEQHNIAN
jgi:hypothetical protein